MAFSRRVLAAAVVLSLAVVSVCCYGAEKAAAVYPTALFPFAEKGIGAKGYGEKVSDLLFAALVAKPDLYLVDRAEMQKILEEQELNLSGAVAEANATKVGQLTGAKILVTGSVVEVDKKLFLVAKVIGTETSRVLGASENGTAKDELDKLVGNLAEKVYQTIVKRAGDLVAKEVNEKDRIAALKEKLGNAKRPDVLINITERHVGQATIDPAAETEMGLLCKETGFGIVDAGAANAKAKADIIIKGEAFSEFATRRGNLVSVKARVEIKAVDTKTDKVIAVDRQTAIVVDLTEQIAGKAALQKAAAEIAERLLPKLVKKE